MKILTRKQHQYKRHIYWYYRRLPIMIIGLFLLASCSRKQAKSNDNEAVETTTEYKPQSELPKKQKKMMLCRINGEEWYYTEVRSRKIISTDNTPKKKFVLNFKNTDTQAGESINLMFNANTKELEYVDMVMQNPNDEPGRRIFFGIKGVTDEELAQIKDIGMLTDISDEMISGTASFTIAKNSKGVFQNDLDEDISVTDFNFTKIPFEDESED